MFSGIGYWRLGIGYLGIGYWVFVYWVLGIGYWVPNILTRQDVLGLGPAQHPGLRPRHAVPEVHLLLICFLHGCKVQECMQASPVPDEPVAEPATPLH